jgi:hypothetical protein
MNARTAERQFLTPDQVADLLQVERRQLHRLGVPCLRLGRKTCRYNRDEVLRWLRTRTAK